MTHLVHFDPAITSRNLGDRIISDSVRRLLAEDLPWVRRLTSTTQVAPGWESLVLARHALVNVVGGTNCLTPHRHRYAMWKIGLPALLGRVRFLLMGVGGYGEGRPGLLSSAVYRWCLHPRLLHACRDARTTEIVRSLGLRALNTGCPTMWSLDDAHCRRIPTAPAEEVVFTLTDYLPDPPADRVLIRELRRTYGRLAFWPQGLSDLPYLRHLTGGDLTGITLVPPTLEGFQDFLRSHPCDYVGTRLHGGIQALQLGRRTLILGIDNRAREIALDTDLPVLPREEIGSVGFVLRAPLHLRLRLPWAAIGEWRGQLRELGAEGAASMTRPVRRPWARISW